MQVSNQMAVMLAIVGFACVAYGVWIKSPPKERCVDVASIVRWYSKFGLMVAGVFLLIGALRALMNS